MVDQAVVAAKVQNCIIRNYSKHGFATDSVRRNTQWSKWGNHKACHGKQTVMGGWEENSEVESFKTESTAMGNMASNVW